MSDGSWILMSIVLGALSKGERVGMVKVRETEGMAVRPDRSASRLLAASQISSFSPSEGSQPRGLMIIRVRYAGMPSSLIDGGLPLLLSLLVASHDDGFMASWESIVSNDDAGGFWWS